LAIARLRISDSKLLEYLEQSGLLPGIHIKLVERPRFGGDLQINIKGRRLAFSLQAAKGVFVTRRGEI
ncbi:MAG: FeoA family protein, partial [Pyrinomonadaceae bacterium]